MDIKWGATKCQAGHPGDASSTHPWTEEVKVAFGSDEQALPNEFSPHISWN